MRESVEADIQHIETKYREDSAERPFHSKTLDMENRAEDITIRKVRKDQSILQVSVQALLFLQTRPMTPKHGNYIFSYQYSITIVILTNLSLGTAFVALNTGVIQVYSHHQHGSYINEFISVHKPGDCILTMCSDRKNRYLFTGSAFGYIKIWHIENYW